MISHSLQLHIPHLTLFVGVNRLIHGEIEDRGNMDRGARGGTWDKDDTYVKGRDFLPSNQFATLTL